MNSRHNYLAPEELMQLYPQVEKIGWTASKIGTFYSAGLLHGHHSSKERKVLILQTSFIKLLSFANEISTERLIDLNGILGL